MPARNTYQTMTSCFRGDGIRGHADPLSRCPYRRRLGRAFGSYSASVRAERTIAATSSAACRATEIIRQRLDHIASGKRHHHDGDARHDQINADQETQRPGRGDRPTDNDDPSEHQVRDARHPAANPISSTCSIQSWREPAIHETVWNMPSATKNAVSKLTVRDSAPAQRAASSRMPTTTESAAVMRPHKGVRVADREMTIYPTMPLTKNIRR